MPGVKIDKEWTNAVRRAVREYHLTKDESGKVRKLRWLNVIASRLVTAAVGGDLTAMKEIGDRLDGRPQMAVNINQTVTLIDLLGEVHGDSDPAPLADESQSLRDRSTAGHA